MEQITDIIFTKRSVLKTNDPYSLALTIKEIASHYGTVDESVHEYDTNGPRKVVKLNFDIKSHLNKHTYTILSFVMKGQIGASSFLEVRVTAKSITELATTSGLVSQAYGQHYLKSIFPVMKKESDFRLREISSQIEQDVKNVLYKYV